MTADDERVVENRAALSGSPAREVALDCLAAGIAAARPDRVVRDAVGLDGSRLRIDVPGTGPEAEGASTVDLDGFDEIVVLGGGKAAAGVTAALEDVLGDCIDGGIVVTETVVETEYVDVREGDHPVPSRRNVEATRDLLDRADAVGENALVLAVLTGGASALLAAPAEGLDLDDLEATTEKLLDSGAVIDEMNAVRKHCSAVKGGQLARAVAPATVVTLALSDVVGDDLSVIGSGPTVPDPSTFADALDVLDRFALEVPAAVRERLERGRDGELAETPKPGDAIFDRASAHVVASGYTALAAAHDAVRDRADDDATDDHVADDGYEPCVLSSRFEGEARELAGPHVAVAAETAATGNPIEPPAVLLSGGEATVTVEGDGTGGPSQEFALAAALDLREIPGVDDGRSVVVAAVDTDGRDGATDAAGALVDVDTVSDADRDDAGAALAENDVYPFLDERDALARTGTTGTNVNDLRIVVIGRRKG